MVYGALTLPALLVAVTVNVYDPAVVGVPEMGPVVGSRVRPGGRSSGGDGRRRSGEPCRRTV